MSFINPFNKMPCPFCNQEFYPGDYLVISRVANKILYPKPRPLSPQVSPQGPQLPPPLPMQQSQQFIPPHLIEQAKKQLKERGPLRKLISHIWMKPVTAYKGELASLYCPNCSNILALNTMRIDNSVTIAIIGDAFSGKSHYITSLIDQLKRLQRTSNKTFQAIASSQDMEDHYQQVFYQPLFNRKKTLPFTPVAKVGVNKPLIYEITAGDDDTSGKRFNLLIYDASGEDLRRQITMIKHHSHILNAQAIIFLADPWSMPKFVHSLPHRLRPDPNIQLTFMPHELLSWVVQTFVNVRPELAQDFSFSLPTAIVMPKCDLIQQHLLLGQEREFELLWRPEYARIYNTDSHEVNTLMRKLLSNLEEWSLLGAVQHFKSARFFAISATGSAPNEDDEYVNGIRPHRCLDPLLWILNELDLLE